jgi:peptidyl-prolyl cis-trans isomerase A (cyclophilin A)
VAVSYAWAQPAQAKDPVVVMKTSEGTMEITLDPEHAPITTANFLKYVDKKFYDGLLIYRIAPGFVVQGGGLSPQGSGKQEDPPIKNEAASSGLHNLRGTISMARTSDPDSASTQFFLNLGDNSAGKLDPGGFSPEGYAVFGKITKGEDVLDKMAALASSSDGPPTKTITIISVRRK